LSTFLPRYAERYPGVQVTLVESAGVATLAMLQRGEVHLGIGLVDAAQADDRQLAIKPVRPLELMAGCHPLYPLERGDDLDVTHVISHPLLVSDSSFAARRTFETICRLAKVTPNILLESRAHHTNLVLAEAGLGVAIISSTVQTHRYRLRTLRITYKRKPITEPLAVVWDKRRTLPRYAQDFCDLLAAHMRKIFPLSRSRVNRVRRRPRAS
jgi:DNA-binding transcriptional LysR family regulator